MPDQGACTQTRVKLDVDCSSLLRPHSTQTQLQSAAYIPESQPRSPCSSSSLPAEESSSDASPKVDLPPLRPRVLPSALQRAASRHSTPVARALCSPITIRVAPCSLRCGRAASAIPRAGRASSSIFRQFQSVIKSVPIRTRTSERAPCGLRVAAACGTGGGGRCALGHQDAGTTAGFRGTERLQRRSNPSRP